MHAYMADAGTLRIMESLTGAGRQVLFGFIRRCAMQRPTSPKETVELGSIHFARDDVDWMRLERRPGDADRRVRARTRLKSGGTWNSGSLRLPKTSLPETAVAAATGKPIGALVERSPVQDLEMERFRRHRDGSLSIHCRAPYGAIPYEEPPPRRPERPWREQGWE